MKILFLVIGEEKNASKTFIEQMKIVLTENDRMIYFSASIPYYQIKDILNEDEFKPDYVSIIPINAIINNKFRDIFLEFRQQDEETIYLPLVVLTGEKAKGVLNNCMWNPNLTAEPGILDADLALKQIDTTLYGAIIPYAELINPSYYKEDLKLYGHFYFLNSFTAKINKTAIGIPKTLLFTDVDLSFSDVDNETKIDHFKKAKQIMQIV